MEVWHGLDEVPAALPGCVAAIGVFDGVHRGHVRLLTTAVESSRRLGVQGVAVTFDPHPAAILRPEAAPLLLTTPAERAQRFEALGLGATLVLPFTPELARWSPEHFAERVLVSGLRVRAVVVGADFGFGARARGNAGTLQVLGQAAGYEVTPVDLVSGGTDDERVSSSRIRTLVAAGDMETAAGLLGRPYALRGVVVVGDRRGRTLGYPTANLRLPVERLVPADGIYAGWLTCPEGRLPAAISIGTNPTFAGTERRVEAYVLGRTDLELYGVEVTAEFAARLRPTLTFAGVEELIAQMAVDVEQARKVTRECTG